MSETADRASITYSPWYWVYVYATAGLIALVLMGPKYAARQTQIEEKAEARAHAAQSVAGSRNSADEGEEADTWITLLPLYVILGAVLAVAWVRLGLSQWRRSREEAAKQGPEVTT